jgi:phage-related protein
LETDAGGWVGCERDSNPVEGEHRLFYIAGLRRAIYVRHVIRKKSKKISKSDIDLARARFQEALRMEALKK